LIPKLVLQPLVENAVYHGIEGQENGGVIWVSALKFDHELLISVRDNGKGMAQTKIDELNESISKQPSNEVLRCHAGDSLGLNNIAQRLRLMYGEGGSLSIDGSPGQGLVVTISIQLLPKGD
jgi:two-component system sensor histidine kinase YesM